MNDQSMELEEFEADFALGGEVEYEESDGDDAAAELEQLLVRVQAARSF